MAPLLVTLVQAHKTSAKCFVLLINEGCVYMSGREEEPGNMCLIRSGFEQLEHACGSILYMPNTELVFCITKHDLITHLCISKVPSLYFMYYMHTMVTKKFRRCPYTLSKEWIMRWLGFHKTLQIFIWLDALQSMAIFMGARSFQE